jgi:predicted small lipoprotein YifL
MKERMRWILLASVVALAGCGPSAQDNAPQRRITEEANALALRQIEMHRQIEAEMTPK